ncbi:PQQ-dependent sugar dehydrogenase [Fibrella aquatilis]|uniref:PQQ-dependent sugar dehydrogenase n=1 Tax=Fibrella aquatilis TaxID=2817059 RepID=A0A939G2I5_9BACT|nr:PQQ-dependent sugar dehydrogenase [Fibrella aquatilis]MBO0929900.1 PQQ-dependent sugar dehydrogenase [Fibrella aquatilis]
MLYKTVLTLLYSLAATSCFSFLVAWACATEQAPNINPVNAAATVRVVNAHPSLNFDAPVLYTYAPDGTNRMFVLEQAGRIKVVDQATNASNATTYLDIKNKVAYGGEMGLLGLAFHPNFKQNGFLYVNYTREGNGHPRETVISRFKAPSANATQIDPATETILLTFRQPYANHNGGGTMFGPDGYLYISTGDGGSGGDPQNNAQNRTSLLGKMLRIDVNGTDKGNYGIPKDNPYVGNGEGFREEIYAYGLRNPWRFSFDKKGQLWVGDVGQNKLEEVDVVTKGGNYGWRIREALDGYKPTEKAADPLIGPIHEYSHANGDLSITGGVVYEGKALPELANKYIFADYVSGRVWALTPTGSNKATNQTLIDRAGTISSFGEDRIGEVYLCDHAEGKILKLVK